MRRVAARFRQLLLGTSASLVLVVPPLGFLAWAGAYLYTVYDAALAPGVPLNFEYAAPGGKYRLSTDSYQVDPRTGNVVAYGLRLRDAKGREMVHARKVEIKSLPGGAREITATGVDALAERRRDGRFEWEFAIPQFGEGGPEQAFSFRGRDCRVRYRDLGTPGGNLDLVAERFNLDGMGADFIGEGVVEAPGLGRVPIRGKLFGQRDYDLTLRLSKADPKVLIPVAKGYVAKGTTFPTWTQAELSGEIRLIGNTSGDLKAYGPLRIASEGVTYPGWLENRGLGAELALRGEQATGEVALSRPGSEATAKLKIDWSEATRVTGTGRLAVRDRAALEPEWRKIVAFDGFRDAAWQGQFGFRGETWWADGPLTVAQITADRERISDLKGQLRADGKQVLFTNADATWRGIQASGNAALDLRRNELIAVLSSKQVELQPLLRGYGINGVSGRAAVELGLSGKPDRPVLDVRAKGIATVRDPNLRRPIPGFFEAAVRGTPANLTLDRFVFRSREGAAMVLGSFQPPSGQMDLAFRASGIMLRAFQPDAGGTAYARGTVAGTFRDPRLEFLGEGFRLRFGETETPYARVGGRYRGGVWTLPVAEVHQGLARAKGSLTLNQKTGRIQGKFQSPALQLAEFGEGKIAGAVQVTNGIIGGTLDEPTFSADLRSEAVAFEALVPRRLQGRIEGNAETIQFKNLQGEIVEGDQKGLVTLDGTFAVKSQTLVANARWTGVPLGPLAQLGRQFVMKGVSEGSAKATLVGQDLRTAEAELRVEGLAMNAEPIGAGSLSVKVNNGIGTATGSVGSIDRFLAIDTATFNLKDQSGESRLTAFNLPVSKLNKLTEPLFAQANPEARDILRALEADFGADMSLNWTPKGVNGTIREGAITAMRLRGSDAGAITFNMTKTGDAVRLDGLNWLATLSGDQPTNVRFTGDWDPAKGLAGDAEVRNFPLPWLTTVKPDLQAIPGILDQATLSLQGQPDDLRVRGSARLVAIAREANTPPPSLDLDDLRYEARRITATGQFQARGFTGRAEFESPLSALIPGTTDRQPGDTFRLTAEANPRSLQDFADLFPGLDLERSKGRIGAEFTATGTVDAPRLAGVANILAERLVAKGTRTELTNSTVTLASDGDRLSLDLNLNSSAGGNLSGSASAPLNLDFERPLRDLLASIPLEGRLVASGFTVNEGAESTANFVDLLLGDSQIDLSGTLASPLLKGNVRVARLNADIPMLGGEGEPWPDLLVNPRFDLRLETVNPARLRSISSNFVGTGGVTVGGQLTAPVVDGQFRVSDGILKLPNSRVQLDDGGLVEISVRSTRTGDTVVRVPVQLTGRTSVTARRPGDRYERYDITLFVRGDLADPSQALSLTGTSDPGDLSQSEILAIVGQRELIDSLVNVARDGRSNELQNLLLGYALPGLFDPITGNIANTLGFDYLNLEYNPFEGPTIGAAKSLSRFLTLQGRRRIPSFGYEDDQYEWRLVYRLPSRDTFLSRSRLSLVNATRRPWRVAFEYSIRF